MNHSIVQLRRAVGPATRHLGAAAWSDAVQGILAIGPDISRPQPDQRWSGDLGSVPAGFLRYLSMQAFTEAWTAAQEQHSSGITAFGMKRN